mmetsp:Transcript_113223/g.292999  ORF Transcript_113223/g.292999 Transcript_113223/m.292999 type:complete len:340 (-) Transcript_113223:7-1026(-)
MVGIFVGMQLLQRLLENGFGPLLLLIAQLGLLLRFLHDLVRRLRVGGGQLLHQVVQKILLTLVSSLQLLQRILGVGLGSPAALGLRRLDLVCRRGHHDFALLLLLLLGGLELLHLLRLMGLPDIDVVLQTVEEVSLDVRGRRRHRLCALQGLQRVLQGLVVLPGGGRLALWRRELGSRDGDRLCSGQVIPRAWPGVEMQDHARENQHADRSNSDVPTRDWEWQLLGVLACAALLLGAASAAAGSRRRGSRRWRGGRGADVVLLGVVVRDLLRISLRPALFKLRAVPGGAERRRRHRRRLHVLHDGVGGGDRGLGCFRHRPSRERGVPKPNKITMEPSVA